MWLTQQNINDLRDTISGEVNKGRAAIVADDTSIKITTLQETNATLQAENQNLKAAITQFNSALLPMAIM